MTSDGRTLGYDDVGDPAGKPVIYLHGTPDSRLARYPDDRISAQAGIRLVAVDRPGYGGSSAPPVDMSAQAVQAQFASDLAVLLDHLGIGPAGLLAWSGGALGALGTAAALGDRIVGVTLVAGIVPREAFDDPEVKEAAPARAPVVELAADLPPLALAETVAPMMAPFPCDEPLAAEHQSEHRDTRDQAALASIPGGVEQMSRALVEAVRGGLRGVETDLVAQYYPGALEPAAVKVPVHLIYGAADQVAPPAFGAWYAAHLPDARLEVVTDAGHFLLFTHWSEILDSLAGR